MAKLNVILEARGKDRGARKQLRDLTKLADEFTEAAEKATAAGQGMGKIGPVPVAGGGGRRGGGLARGRPRSRSRFGGGASRPRRDPGPERRAKKRASTERQFNRALEDALKDQRSIANSLNKQDRAQRKAARNIKNMSDEQLVAVELTREQNRRRRKMAKTTASGRLGADPSAPRRGRGGGGRGKLEFAENLAVAGGEFEQFGDQIERGVRGGFDAFKDFEKAVVEVSTLTDDISIEEIRKITEGAAKEFGGLPTEQVKAFYGIVSAGATTAAEATEQLRAANQLATGGVATQEEAVLAISKAVANFGVTSTEAADSLFTAVKDGQTTVSELSTAMPQVAQAASDVGLSLDETNVALAVLSKRSGTAKIGANNLKAAIANLKKPTKDAVEEAERLGIEFNSGSIKAAGGLQEFLKQLRDTEKFDENTISKLFGSVEAQSAIGGLLGGIDDIDNGLVDMSNSTGAAAAASDKMMATSAKKAELLEAKWELLKISAGESLVPALTDLAEEVGPIIEDVTTWIKENPKLAGTIGKLAIGVGVLSRGIGVATSVISMISTVSGLAATDMTKLGNSTATTTGKMGKFSSVNLAGPIIAATAAVAAFEIVLSQAQKPLDKFEQTITGIEEEQQAISFQDEEGKDKSEADLLSERRGRLISVVNAARTAESESAVGGVSAGANILEKGIASYAGALNRATGVTDTLGRQTTQAEKDLAAFDAQFGTAAGLTEEQKFEAPSSGFDPAAMNRLFGLAESIASNTGSTGGGDGGARGPSMEAGLV